MTRTLAVGYTGGGAGGDGSSMSSDPAECAS